MTLSSPLGDPLQAPEVGLPAPDALIYLTMGPEDAAARGGFGEERYETLEMQRAVQEKFEALRDDSWTVVDAAQDIEAVHRQVRAAVDEALTACRAGRQPLRALWDGTPFKLTSSPL